jgi:Uma2 family endonuclease
MPPAVPPSLAVELRYRVEPPYDRWVLEDEPPMPESNPHRTVVQSVESQLKVWARRHRPRALVGGSLAIRWDGDHPRVGVDPDVYLVDPAPPEGHRTRSLLSWREGHRVPQLAVEVVSTMNAKKDYVEVPAKYAACGVDELWVFDPELAGPALGGGPHLLQLWRRDARGRFRRVYCGPGPVLSRFVGAWLVVVEGEEGPLLRLANDALGRDRWPTEAEQARQLGEAEGRAEGEAQGRAEGEARGRAEGLRTAVLALCEVLGVAVDERRRAELGRMGVAELESLCDALKRRRRWPGRPRR